MDYSINKKLEFWRTDPPSDALLKRLWSSDRAARLCLTELSLRVQAPRGLLITAFWVPAGNTIYAGWEPVVEVLEQCDAG